MNKYFTILFLIISLSSFSQPNEELTFKSLQSKLVDFLIDNGDIRKEEIQEYKEGKRIIRVLGVLNGHNQGKLINGIYSFAMNVSHHRAYFAIIEDNQITVLNISTREGLDTAIKNTLDFCDKNKYCGNITNDYISRLIGVYYNINKNPLTRSDFNCQRGIKDTKNLP